MRISKAGSGIANSAASGIVIMLAGLLLIPLVIRTIGADSYGIWLTISVLATYLYYSDLGIGLAIVHFGSRARSTIGTLDNSTLLSCGLVWALSAWLIIAPIFYFAADALLGGSLVKAGISESETKALILLGLVLLSAMILKPYASMLTGAGFLSYERRNQMAGAVVRVIGTVVACFVFGEVVAVAIAEVFAILTPPILSARLVQKNSIARFRFKSVRISAIRSMFNFSIRAFATGAVGALILQAGTVIAAIVGSPSDVTYFTAAFRIYSSVRQLVSWITDPFRPLMSRMWVTETERARTLLLRYLLVSCTASVMLCTFLILSAGSLVGLWLGPNVPEHEISITVVVLLVGMAINVIHIPLIPALDGAGKPGALLHLQVIWLLTYVALSLPLGSRYGIAGIALAMTAPLIVLEPAYWFMANRILNLGFSRWAKAVALPSVATLAIGLIIAGITASFMAVLHLSASGLFLGVAFLTGAIIGLVLLRDQFQIKELISAMKVEL